MLWLPANNFQNLFKMLRVSWAVAWALTIRNDVNSNHLNETLDLTETTKMPGYIHHHDQLHGLKSTSTSCTDSRLDAVLISSKQSTAFHEKIHIIPGWLYYIFSNNVSFFIRNCTDLATVKRAAKSSKLTSHSIVVLKIFSYCYKTWGSMTVTGQ